MGVTLQDQRRRPPFNSLRRRCLCLLDRSLPPAALPPREVVKPQANRRAVELYQERRAGHPWPARRVPPQTSRPTPPRSPRETDRTHPLTGQRKREPMWRMMKNLAVPRQSAFPEESA